MLTGKSGRKFSIRKDGKQNKYVKKDASGEISRDSSGMAEYLSADEMKAQGLPAQNDDMVAFYNGKPVATVSNEFGAIGVWVEKEYQGDE